MSSGYSERTYPLNPKWDAFWVGSFSFMLVLTALWSQFKRKMSEKTKPRRLSFYANESGNEFVQQGFRTHWVGCTIFKLWTLFPVMGYVGLIVLTYLGYNFEELDLGMRWVEIAEPFLICWSLTHIVLAIIRNWRETMQTFFMVETSLENAEFVLVKEIDESRLSVESQSLLKSSENGQSQKRVPSVLVEVKEIGPIRFFEYTCIRYIWSAGADRFIMPHTDILSGPSCHERVQQGGQSEQLIHKWRVEAGDNTVHVEVPSVARSLIDTFLTPMSIYQFANISLFWFYYAWNISAVYLMMAVTTGVYRALFIVRKTQKQISEMASEEVPARVFRNGQWITISSHHIVPGDVVMVEEGKSVPCDLVLTVGNVVVNESMLTGEALPIQKFAVDVSVTEPVDSKSHKKHVLFSGTNVMQSCAGPDDGFAVGVVMSIGAITAKGSLVRMVLFPTPSRQMMDGEMTAVAKIVMFFAGCMALGCLFTNIGCWITVIFASMSFLSQSLNPNIGVMLCMGQSVASGRLTDKKIQCLQPERIPVAGRVQVMVFDKTGTITKGGMDFLRVQPIVDGDFKECVDVKPDPEWVEALPVHLQTTLGTCHTVTRLTSDNSLIGNAVEVAMFQVSNWEMPDPTESNQVYRALSSNLRETSESEAQVIRQLDFCHERMTSGCVVRAPNGKTTVLLKGSYEVIANMAGGVPKNYKDVTEQYAREQFYLLASGARVLPEGCDVESMTRDALEQDLNMTGLLLFRNEMKPDSPDAIKQLRDGNVRCIMCTGDNALTGVTVAKKCGMILKDDAYLATVEDGSVVWRHTETNLEVSDAEVMAMPDAELCLDAGAFRQLYKDNRMASLIDRVRVLARMKPNDKVLTINLVQDNDVAVGMVGDGGNDCGALRAADVGLALSDSEASLVSPFSTQRKDLQTVVDILATGRGTLMTNIATFQWYIVYGIAYPFFKMSSFFTTGGFATEFQIVFMDLFCGMFMVAAMCMSKPNDKLSKVIPLQRLNDFKTVVGFLIPNLYFMAAFFVLFFVLTALPWYSSLSPMGMLLPAELWGYRGDGYLVECTFLLTVVHLTASAISLSLGGANRQNILKNKHLMCVVALVAIMVSSLIFQQSTTLNCTFRVNCDTKGSMAMVDSIINLASAFSVGGCMYAPQIYHQIEKMGTSYVDGSAPSLPKNKCYMDDVSGQVQGPAPPGFALNEFFQGAETCVGPNNCLPDDGKYLIAGIVSIVLICCVMTLSWTQKWSSSHKLRFRL